MDPPPNNQANTNRKIEQVQRQVQAVTSVNLLRERKIKLIFQGHV